MSPPPESPDSPNGEAARAASLRRMDEEMRFRDLTAQTRESYRGHVRRFLRWTGERGGRLPDEDSGFPTDETADYYRFFDATRQAELLYGYVQETVERDLPAEVAYLEGYDEFSRRVQEHVADMPDRTIELLTRFLGRNDGSLSKQARSREFRELSADEVGLVKQLYDE